MNKYVYAVCTTDEYPKILSFFANSYEDATDKVKEEFYEKLDDDAILKQDTWEDLQDYLNEEYYIALSELEIYEEI